MCCGDVGLCVDHVVSACSVLIIIFGGGSGEERLYSAF